MDMWNQIALLREELAAQLAQLAPADWDTPSLCAGWRARDVVAHLTLPARFSPLGGLGGLIRSGFSLDMYIQQDAIRRGSAPVAEVLAAYRAAIPYQSVPPKRRPANVLADLAIHMQDIRRAIGLPWSFDPEVLTTVASTVHADAGLGVPTRMAGLHLRSTDTTWDAGDGAEVTGPLEALVLAMAGRPAVASELDGPGVDTVGERIGAHDGTTAAAPDDARSSRTRSR